MRRLGILIMAWAAGLVAPARATWSIIVVDVRTREIAVGAATCVPGIDLKFDLPVVRVGRGAGCAQAAIDTTNRNRRIILRGLEAGTDPREILRQLERDRFFQTRQYGIVDVFGRAVTFTGSENGAYASGLTGRIGDLVYAIQGNVITGQPVLDEAERALRETPGGLPEKLMAAMEAARAMGGDGRCSCNPSDPPGCGAPPPDFERVAWVAFLIDARRGDPDGGTCRRGEPCVGDDYYLCINRLTTFDPPVIEQLRSDFDAWRAALVGKPDAVESLAAVTPDHVLAGQPTPVTLRIELRDWQQLPATDITGVRVVHDDDSAGSSAIGSVQDLGDGVFEVTLTPGTTPGHDTFKITATYSDSDGDGSDEEVILTPSPALRVQDPAADFNHDGIVDMADLSILLSAFGLSDAGDLNGDGITDLIDLARILDYVLPPQP